MKNIISALLACFILLFALGSSAEVTNEWICSSCGATVSGNFCSNCGAPKPSEGDTASASENKCHLTLAIDFEENLMFSTYDVVVLIDDEVIATMPHGIAYTGSIDLSPGDHTLEFQRSGKASVNGAYSFSLSGDSTLKCQIHAKSDKVKITNARIEEKTETIPATSESSEDQILLSAKDTAIEVNGKTRLNLAIEFEQNLAFSTYDVEMFLDDTFIATLLHGENYSGVLGVSTGTHVLKFQEVGKASVKGISQFTIREDTDYSCTIQAKRNQIKISKEKLGNNDSPISKEDYIASSTTVKYKDVERNPDDSKGLIVSVSGKVIQVSEGWFDTVILRIKDTNSDIWYVTYTRQEGESRILENDKVTVYGMCEGVKTYTTILGGSVTIPAIKAKYVDVR